MKIQYLEIVTREVEAVCAAYASALNVQFGEPDAGLGGRAPLQWQAVGSWESAHLRARQKTRLCGLTGLWTTLMRLSPQQFKQEARSPIRQWRFRGMARSPSIFKAAMITVCGSCRRLLALGTAA